MSPRRSSRWSRPAAWPTWWGAAAGAGAPGRRRAPGAARLPAIADAVLHQKTVPSWGLFGAGRITWRLGTMRAQPRAGLRGRRALAVPTRRRPYQAADGSEWPDNLQRFALLGWMAAHLAGGELDAAGSPSCCTRTTGMRPWRLRLLAAHPANAVPRCSRCTTSPTRACSLARVRPGPAEWPLHASHGWSTTASSRS